MITAVGWIADALGLCRHTAYGGSPDGLTAWRDTAWSTYRSSAYARYQPFGIPVHYRHGGAVLGRVIHLERDDNRIVAVAELDGFDDPAMFADVNLRFSPSLAERDGEFMIHELSLTPRPATVGLPVVQFFAGDVAAVACRSDAPRGTLRCATATMKTHARQRYSVPLRRFDLDGGVGFDDAPLPFGVDKVYAAGAAIKRASQSRAADGAEETGWTPGYQGRTSRGELWIAGSTGRVLRVRR